MGVRGTQAGETEQSREPVDDAAATGWPLFWSLKRKLSEWSQVHARMQVELLTGQPPDR